MSQATEDFLLLLYHPKNEWSVLTSGCWSGFGGAPFTVTVRTSARPNSSWPAPLGRRLGLDLPLRPSRSIQRTRRRAPSTDTSNTGPCALLSHFCCQS
jgi:hypothetical protein